MLDDDPEKKAVKKKELSVTDLMKDTHLVERYSKYLNKCLFMTNDSFIKRKHQQYLEMVGIEKNETFYERMEKDKKRREDKIKANPLNVNQNATRSQQ